jgi:hypothetical protein
LNSFGAMRDFLLVEVARFSPHDFQFPVCALNLSTEGMDERFLSFREVGELSWLPPRRNNSHVAPSTVWRWATTGGNGVVLRTIRIGRSFFTTETWLKTFFEESAAPTNPADRRLIRTPKRRAREIASTQDRLARKGFSRAIDAAAPESRSEDKESIGQLL